MLSAVRSRAAAGRARPFSATGTAIWLPPLTRPEFFSVCSSPPQVFFCNGLCYILVSWGRRVWYSSVFVPTSGDAMPEGCGSGKVLRQDRISRLTGHGSLISCYWMSEHSPYWMDERDRGWLMTFVIARNSPQWECFNTDVKKSSTDVIMNHHLCEKLHEI